MEKPLEIRFRVFRPVDDMFMCEKYIQGHVNVLRDYGITNITSNNTLWTQNPDIYAVVAESMDGRNLYGGIRVQIANDFQNLPVQEAIGEMDNRLNAKVEEMRIEGGCGELTALWNSKLVKGYGVSVFLTRAAISIIDQLKFKILIGICGDYTLEMFSRVGFVIEKELGESGGFPYPKQDMIAWVLGIMNAKTLETAHPEDRDIMLSLRENALQAREEYGPKGKVIVHYDLKVA
jgi:hypothetical protein